MTSYIAALSWFVSQMVGYPEDGFSHDTAQFARQLIQFHVFSKIRVIPVQQSQSYHYSLLKEDTLEKQACN